MRRVSAFALVTLLAVASLAAALVPADDPSPIADKTIGQLNGEAMRDAAFEARVQEYLRDHGVNHPQKLVDVQTAEPLDRARAVLTQERIQGRTPQEWVGLASPDALQSLRPAPLADADLVDAVARIAAATGSPFTPAERADVAAQAAAMPDDVRAPLARLAARVADAYEAQVPLAKVVVARAHAADEALDMTLTASERDAMLANALAVVAATNAFRDETQGLQWPATSTPIFRDPLGLVIVGSSGNDLYQRTGALQDPVLSVDPAGDDTYQTTAGGACPDLLSVAHVCNGLALSVALDLDGADLYTLSATEPTIAQGAGSIGGVGILVDVAGNDVYNSHMHRTNKFPVFNYVDGGAQAFGQAGVGILLDAGGNDSFTADVSTSRWSIWDLAQGYGGVGGVGLLANAGGDDQYLAHGLASSMGPGEFQGVYTNGVSIYAGVGVSVDAGRGNDRYYAWDQATSTDYYAQGFGAFGGLGVLVEDGGDDDYTAGEEIVNNPTGANTIVPLLNCAFGTGSFAGVGVFLEFGGHDTYFGDTITPRIAYTMNEGFGGPGMAYGLFVDVSGDDGHFMEAHGTQGSYTFGRGVFVLGGNILLGSGGNMLGTYLDAGGADQYTGASPSRDNAQWVIGADVNLVPNGLLW